MGKGKGPGKDQVKVEAEDLGGDKEWVATWKPNPEWSGCVPNTKEKCPYKHKRVQILNEFNNNFLK